MTWLWPFLVGIALGLVYFGGLWLTVGWVTRHSRRALWLLPSGIARLAILVIVFSALSRTGASTLLASFAGLWCARGLLIRRIGAVR